MYININNISKSFKRDAKALINVSLTFAKGKIHGIVGRNGSGKTVLFKCICGYIVPEEGAISINGKIIGKEIAFPTSLGLILEAPGFLPNFSGRKNLEMLYTIKNKINKEAISSAMATVGLDYNSNKSVGKYSLGMRQRLGIAQAIMEDPELLILDEPFNGLDNQGVKEIRDLLLSLKEKNVTILLASHNPTDIELLCDTVTYLDGGKVTSSSTKD